MGQPGSLTRSEIFSQPEAWAAALETMTRQAASLHQFFMGGEFDSVIFTGCGSTYYLALATASTFQALRGKAARGLPASEIWLYPSEAYGADWRDTDRRVLLVAVSRSGSTTETLRAVEAFRQREAGSVVTLTCYPDAPLAKMGDFNLLFPEAQEESVAQTRAFSTLYLATVALSAIYAGKDELLGQMQGLPAAGRRLIDSYAQLAECFGRDSRLERFYFLGSGARYGLACEISLKMKEMSLSHSEPFHFMEFRHGPMSMVNEHTLLMGLLSESNFDQERAVLNEMQAKGAAVIAVHESRGDVVFQSNIQEVIRNILYLPVGQLLAFEHSIYKGLNPDRPHNLEAVVKL
jgi:glucosamine--fructose-6-phosphate aminotransferase (isomerizing)